VLVLVGDDWAEGHHDVELMDHCGRTLARARLAEGLAGMARLHAMLGEHLGQDDEEAEVRVGIETDRGPWVTALAAAGYAVYAVNPLQAARYRERHTVSGAKSDAGDAHVLADMVRTDAHQLRLIAADSPAAQAVKVVARAHKTLIWERSRQVHRLRYQLRDFFPAALEAYPDLAAPDALELLAKAPGPASAARLTTAQISAALKRAGRRGALAERAAAIRAALRCPQLAQPPQVTAAGAAVVRALAAVITTLNQQIKALEGQVEAHFREHPDAEIILSQPGLGPILGARVLAEFGDDPSRYASAKARKNYAATSPITRQSGKRKTVMARYVHNDRLRDAPGRQAYSALTASAGARAYYDQLRARNIAHEAALRQLGNRLVGILHGCLKTRTPYNEATAWPQHANGQFPTAA
jgi:Transposase/Transposase IS116/IS110/IS902 family